MWPVYVNRSCFQFEFSASLLVGAFFDCSVETLTTFSLAGFGVAVGFTITLVREAIEFWMMATIGGFLPW